LVLLLLVVALLASFTVLELSGRIFSYRHLSAIQISGAHSWGRLALTQWTTMSAPPLISIKAVALLRFDVERRMPSIKVSAQLLAHAVGVKQKIDSPMLFMSFCGV
jgi:hypothetical protein